MLKVGDKVKVREDLEVGKKFDKCEFTKEMKKYRGNLAKIEFICGRFILLDIDNQEFGWTEEMFDGMEENNNMRQLIFREVITDIKDGEVWGNENYIIKCSHGIISIKTKNREVFNGIAFGDDTLFTLQRKQYSFEEALKSFDNGKEIESCISNFKYRIYNNKTISVASLTYDKKRLVSKDDNNFTVNEVQNKWYIND